jgi:hypothetical protein
MKISLRNLALVLTLAVTASAAIAHASTVAIKGYLLDKMCSAKAMKAKDPEAVAKKHTKECAEKCTDSGFGIVANNKYYLFDAKGNELADALLKATQKTDSLAIEVVGTVDGDKINVESLKEIE